MSQTDIEKKNRSLKNKMEGKQRILEHTSYMGCLLFGCAKSYCNISKSIEKYLYGENVITFLKIPD